MPQEHGHPAEILATRPWLEPNFHLPERLRQVPTMLTLEECRMLVWVGRHLISDKGKVCELGCFMGGSTVHLAYGLASNELRASSQKSQSFIMKAVDRWRGRKQLYSFDTFDLPDNVKKTVLDYWHFPDFEGTDLLPVFKRNTAEYSSLIEVHKGDVKQEKWADPIEILFVDCCKDWNTNDAVARTFYPCLIPGQSIIIQQDYLHFQHPWIIATMEALYPRVRPVAYTLENSMIFACHEPIRHGDLDLATGMAAEPEKVLNLISQAQRRFEDPRVKDYLEQPITALRKNPAAQSSWELWL